MADNTQQEKPNNISPNYNQASVGLNTESVITEIKPGVLTDALNASVQNFDGNAVTYQNDTSNSNCITFPEGYKVIGKENITQLSQVIYFLANPTTGHSQIGYTLNHSCIYEILLDDTISGSDQLGFNINHPIMKVEVKTTNCSTQIYWTDKFNPRRYLDLNNLPWHTVTVGGVISTLVGQIDTDKMRIQPLFSVPNIKATATEIGGNTTEGTVQFAVQYSDALGNGYTSYYGVTNPVRIFLDHKFSENFNDVTNKAVNIEITNLDTSGLYDYFNLAVIKKINNIASVELVGTYFIQKDIFTYTYSGNEQSNANIKLTMFDIFERQDYYDLAGDLTQADNTLIWADLLREEDIPYQKIWNQMAGKLMWETNRVPDVPSDNYSNGVTCANFESLMRDEVYAYEGVFILKNGKETVKSHWPGRPPTSLDLALVSLSNLDAGAPNSVDACSPPATDPHYWQVYNTASITGFSTGYNSSDSCYMGPYQYGTMGYHESTRRYPNNVDIWGPLAGQFIRHHRIPDTALCPIHEGDTAIFPIGVKFSITDLRDAINNSTDLTQQQKDDIVGFKILRGNRVNNKTIIAKGMLYNCGHYTKSGSDYFYPNYPYNDVNPDPFISTQPVENKSGNNQAHWIHDFQPSRFTFHSPDTHFYQPTGIENSYLKLETGEYGVSKGHFVKVLNNAGEKLRTPQTLQLAFAAGVISMIGVQGNFATQTGTVDTITMSVGPTFNPQNFFPSFNSMLEIIDKLIPYFNYGWQYNSVGYYTNSIPIPNNGNKIRGIQFGGYITDGLNGTFGDIHSINNTYRESSVYLSLINPLPYTHDQTDITGVNLGIPRDNSRVTPSQIGLCGKSTDFYRNISSYYASIKRYLPDQWGDIFSYESVDTGFTSNFYDKNGTPLVETPTIFGGDVFINRFGLKRKHSYFLKSTVNKPDGTDIDYNQDAFYNTNTGNVGYPVWYYSTDNVSVDISGTFGPGITNLTNLFNTTGGLIVLFLSGGLALVAVMLQILGELVITGADILEHLGLKITNLECYNGSNLYEQGQAYLYSYGIPYYYCESEVNVSMRQATNIKEGNFFPQVGTDIPDEWLAETNTSIIWDNLYVYNKTFSTQNKETHFNVVRPDWSPGNICYTQFPNRAIWSDKSNLEETKNNWLIYRPGNLYDFPKSFGKLVGIDRTEARQIVARFENKAQIYNATATIATSAIAASLGTGDLFSGSPAIDLSDTDTGYGGTQHKMFLKTEQGYIYADAKRGQILLIPSNRSYMNYTKGNNAVDLAEINMDKWFSKNLPFAILQKFPDFPIDNNFNGLGLHGTYDNLYKRFIITKIDYEPIVEGIKWDGNNFYVNETVQIQKNAITEAISANTEQSRIVVRSHGEDDSPTIAVIQPKVISLTNTNYFCNKSWTLSYSFLTNSWVSFHSYLPNYYIAHENYFQSGINGTTSSLWDHNLTYTSFTNYYGTDYPYILEYPFVYKFNDEILQNVRDYCTVLKYQDDTLWTEPKETLYFNKAVISNGQQTTGVLNLIPKIANSLSQYIKYPILHADSKDIILDKRDHFYNFNQFWNILRDPSINIWLNTCSPQYGNKVLNTGNLDYGVRSFQKQPIRGKDAKVRLILDNDNSYKILSKFIVAPTQKSFN